MNDCVGYLIDISFDDLAETILSCHTFSRIIGHFYVKEIVAYTPDFIKVDVCDGFYSTGFEHSCILDPLPIGQDFPGAILTNWHILSRDISYKENRFFYGRNFIQKVDT